MRPGGDAGPEKRFHNVDGVVIGLVPRRARARRPRPSALRGAGKPVPGEINMVAFLFPLIREEAKGEALPFVIFHFK
jgi:hypothetical protein